MDIITVILGGGQGTRLFPLTKDRSKPAVPLAGKYRLIDIPISNCINSGLRRIYVLTMYQSASLNYHIANAYRFDHFSRGFVEPLAAEQTRKGGNWYQGTADAVRQSWQHITDTPSDYILILSGDHLYRMNYMNFFELHQKTSADVSIAVQPASRHDAPQLGLLKADPKGRIVKFMEKPKTEEGLDEMMVDTTSLGLPPEEARQKPYLASMGIYLFKTEILEKVLSKNPQQTDFGKHIIPSLIDQMHVQAYCFSGYWADIGTVGNFFEANMELVQPNPRFKLLDQDKPIYTNARYLPGAKIIHAQVENSMISEGCIVEKANIVNSIVGVRTVVRSGAKVENTFIVGADFYQPPDDGKPPMGIGEGAWIRRTIVDKNVSIGKGVQLINKEKKEEYDDPEDRLYVRDGIIVIPKGAVIPDNFSF